MANPVKQAVARLGGVAYVSELLGVSKAYIYMLMNGQRYPSKRIADQLGLKVQRNVRVTRAA